MLRVFNRYTKNQAVIFMMHRFFDPLINFTPLDDQCFLSPNTLDDCLKYLIKNDYTILSFKDLIQATHEHQPLYKTVCFTIDDGYVDFKNVAFPFFKKYNLPATVFITTDFIEGNLTMWWDLVEYLIINTNLQKTNIVYKNISLRLPLQSRKKKQIALTLVLQKLKLLPLPEILIFLQYFSKRLNVALPDKPPKEYRALHWNDILEMEKHGINFQPHTVTHPILSRINITDQKWQIKMSTETLKKKITSDPTIFCYPNGKFGDYTEKTISILKEEKFIAACTTEPNVLNQTSTNLFQIPRFAFPNNYYKYTLYVSGCKALQLAIKKKITHTLRHCWPKPS